MSDTSSHRGEASVVVAAPPEQVYALVADVTRMPEWSPECYRCAWTDGADAPAIGAKFKGWNRQGRLRWATISRICELEPGRVIGWEVLYPLGRVHTRWRYELTPDDDGTLVRESFELVREPVELRLFRRVFFRGTPNRVRMLEEGMRRTLARLKESAEAAA